VPNTKLHPFNRLGNEVRPWAQTWFADLYEARRTFIKEANLILKNIDVVNSIAGWDNHLNTEVPIGEEKVDVTEMWQYVDYQASDYDSTKSVSLIVGSDADAIRESFNLSAGEYIKVVDVLLKTEVIYEVYNDADIGIVPVWRKNGTIAFNEFTKETYLKRTWDGSPWDFYPWDKYMESLIPLYRGSTKKRYFCSRLSKIL
jgi:hypothetical protein